MEDIDAALSDLAAIGVEPEKPAYHPGGNEALPRIAFVADPDGYRVELIDNGAFRRRRTGGLAQVVAQLRAQVRVAGSRRAVGVVRPASNRALQPPR